MTNFMVKQEGETLLHKFLKYEYASKLLLKGKHIFFSSQTRGLESS